jgi:hypothetical protein
MFQLSEEVGIVENTVLDYFRTAVTARVFGKGV